MADLAECKVGGGFPGVGWWAASAQPPASVSHRAAGPLAAPSEGGDKTDAGAPARRHVLVTRAIEYIAANSHQPLTVQSVSDELQVTRRTLERAFAQGHLRSIAAEIEGCRLERAQQLLGGSAASVKEIGYATGFGGSQRLIRAFRREFGVTPLAFRRLLRRAGAVAEVAWAASRRALECISDPSPGEARPSRDPSVASAA